MHQRMLVRLQKVHRETAERLERCIPAVARAVVQDIVRYDTLSRNMLSLVAALALAVDFVAMLPRERRVRSEPPRRPDNALIKGCLQGRLFWRLPTPTPNTPPELS